MADVKCPSCGKTNPEELEICQFCGTLLKQTRTEPLPPISPGQIPQKLATSELERTLPGWLRDARRAASEPNTSPIPQVKAPQDAPPPPKTPDASPPQKAPDAPFDLLAGLSQASDDEEEIPDWLKSLQGETPLPAAPQPESQEPPDWLAGLQAQPAETEQTPSPEAWGFSSEAAAFNFDESEESTPFFGDAPDWLAALDTRETAPPQSPISAGGLPTESGPNFGDTPDWLSSLGGFEQPSHPQPGTDTPVSDSDLPNWLADLQSTAPSVETSPKDSAAEPPAPVEIPASDLPDWLSGLQTSASSEPPAAEPPAPAESTASDLPDWLSGLQSQPPAAEPPAPAESTASDLPDWLSGLQSQPPAAEPPAPAETPASDLPDWLSGLQASASSEPPAAEPLAPVEIPASDLPDWLSGLQSQPPAAEPPAPVESPASDLPDWLSGLQSQPSAAQPPAPVETPASDLPDWLSGLQSQPPAAEPPAPVESPASDLPDWLSGLQSQPSAAQPPAPAETPASDLPDWLSGLQASASSEPPAAEPLAPDGGVSGNLPDWLASAVGEEPAPKPPLPSPKPFSTGALDEIKALAEKEPVPDFLSGLVPEAEEKRPETEAGALPDWLAGMTAAAAETETTPSLEAQEFVETGAGAFTVPDIKTESVSPASTSDTSQNPVAPHESAAIPPKPDEIDSLLADVPDWLSGFMPDIEAAQTAEAAPPQEAGLSPVELPSWVQAMRPVESMLTGTESADAGEEEVEQHGPLAGFRSVLPVAADALAIRKPKPYALKLQVDETQREQAALLEQLLSSEKESKMAAPPQEISLLRPLRWILFAVLTLAVLIPAVLGTRIFPAPALPTDTNAPLNKFYDTLANSVPDGAPVLVVTDYQPGFAGEMEQAAVPVVTHLMRKNAQMAFLSTSPVSVEMGERLLEKSRAFYKKNGQDAPSYLFGKQYLFLGYLPGGAAGIKAFAEQPQRMTGIDSLSGDLWQMDMLRGKIDDISGFAAVIVITDDPDTSRLWIEQTGARLQNTPLLMVISAQAGPMIQPYAVSGQLSGLVIGLEGGALYEQKDIQPGQNYPGHIKALYWDGFGAALIAALLAIFFGALWSLAERFRARKNKIEQDEA